MFHLDQDGSLAVIKIRSHEEPAYYHVIEGVKDGNLGILTLSVTLKIKNIHKMCLKMIKDP